MKNLILQKSLGNDNYDVYENPDNVMNIGHRVQANQYIAVSKNTELSLIDEKNSYDITPDYVTLLIKSFEDAILTNLILLKQKLG